VSIQAIGKLSSINIEFIHAEDYIIILTAIITYLIIVPSFIHHTLSLNRWGYLLNKWGIFRFVLDVIIVTLYAALVMNLADPASFMFTVSIIFLLYALWNDFRFREYKASNAPENILKELESRANIDRGFYLVLMSLFFVMILLRFEIVVGSILTVVATTQVAYRIMKMRIYFKIKTKVNNRASL